MFSIRRQLKKMRREASPSKDFKKALWSELSASYDEKFGTAPRRTPVFRFAAVGITVVVLCFGLGTGVYAYESPAVSEGHVLHPVKQGIENIEGKMARTPEQRARFHLKMMKRRLDEVEYMQKKKAIKEGALQHVANELGITMQELQGDLQSPEGRRQVYEELAKLNQRYANVLRRVFIIEQGLKRRPLQQREVLQDLMELKREIEESDLSPEDKRQFFTEELNNILEEKGIEGFRTINNEATIEEPSEPASEENNPSDIMDESDDSTDRDDDLDSAATSGSVESEDDDSLDSDAVIETDLSSSDDELVEDEAESVEGTVIEPTITF